MSDPICHGRGCTGRATFVIEPVGEYDPAGWEQIKVCSGHLALNVDDYLYELDRVQISYVGAGRAAVGTTPERPTTP